MYWELTISNPPLFIEALDLKQRQMNIQKTERMAAKKNLESPGTSFTSFSYLRIVSNLGRVSINLGSSDDIVKTSIVSIKNLEIDRMVVHANKKG